jgi:hypothetical protein
LPRRKSIGIGDNDKVNEFEKGFSKDKDEEARYRDYKDNLIREKHRIKRLQEIESLKTEVK